MKNRFDVTDVLTIVAVILTLGVVVITKMILAGQMF